MSTATDSIIATAHTRNNWGIGIIRRGSRYLVVRSNAKHQYIVLTAHTTEEAARASANTYWIADRAA
jgi:hypothetical protein